MQTEKDHGQQLCDLAEKEHDHKRLAELVDALNRILDEEQHPSQRAG